MTGRPLPLPAFFLFGLFLSAPAWAADAAHEWLTKMARATRTLDYEGAFVYQHGSRLESIRIIHKVVEGVPLERLVSLNGMPREIIRDAHEVRCYYPEDNSVVVEQRQTDKHKFPNLLPEPPDDVDSNYVVELGRSGRVAGHTTQLVMIRPRDGYRYGYQLWADRDTGLLLKADLVDEKNQTLEQFLFTQVTVGGRIPLTALAPEMAREGMTWHRDLSESTPDMEPTWQATRLPKGFRLIAQMKREMPMHKKPVEHLVYSDGLAVVSVFIEKQDADSKTIVQGANQMGAVNVYGVQVDGHHVTTIGEVPGETVALIGRSIARRP